MTINIQKSKWSQFFDDLSKRRFGWTTKVEVMNEEIGDQILCDDLPFNGATVGQRGSETTLEISVGEGTTHQSHTITEPTKVAFYDNDENLGGIVEIEEENGSKTLIQIIEPMPVILSYSEYEIVAAVQ